MSKDFSETSKQNKEDTKNGVSELLPSKGDKLDIPLKYLNKNVKAMISGGNLSPVEPTRKYLLRFDKVISFLKKKYRVEINISVNDT